MTILTPLIISPCVRPAYYKLHALPRVYQERRARSPTDRQTKDMRAAAAKATAAEAEAKPKPISGHELMKPTPSRSPAAPKPVLQRQATRTIINSHAQRHSGKKARHSVTSWLVSTWSGNFAFLLGCSGCCLLGFALFWMAVPECDGCGTDASFAQAMWFAWCIFFDPGTQTGLAADGTVSHWHRLIAAIFSIGGFVFNLFLLGVVVDKIRSSLNTFETHNKATPPSQDQG